MSHYAYYEPKKQKSGNRQQGGYQESGNDQYYVDYQPKNKSSQGNYTQEYVPKQTTQYQPKNTNKYQSQEEVQYVPKDNKKVTIQYEQKGGSKYQPKEEYQYVLKETQKYTQKGSYQYQPKQSYQQKEEIKEEFPSLSSNPDRITPEEGHGQQWGKNKKPLRVQETKPFNPQASNQSDINQVQQIMNLLNSGVNVQIQIPADQYKQLQQSAGGYVNETIGGYINQSTPSQISGGGYINSTGGYVDETSGGYVNQTSGGYVNETAQGQSNAGYYKKGGYSKEAEIPAENDYYAQYEQYMREQQDDYYDEDDGEDLDDYLGEEYDDTDAGYDEYYQKSSNETVLVLMVAEKPSIAKSITDALSGGKAKNRRGISKFCPVHEFSGTIFGQKAYFRVTSVAGHIYTTDFPKQYQDWNKVDPAELFKAETIKKEANPKSRLIQHLQKEAKGATYLVLWLDNDKEGENICFEVLENVKDFMKKERFQQVYRAKFSSIVKQDLIEAFHALKDGPNKNESLSVDARQIIDLKIGVAFSRFQTLYFTKRYPQLNAKLITYGPCQTPTLGFCVARDDEIKNFKPRTYYRVVPTIVLPGGSAQELTWEGEGRTFSSNEAIKIKNELESIRELVVTDFTRKEGIKGRPEALNTVHMLKIASSNLGIGPQHAMHIAEKLYLQGYITYPRTESTSYPNKFDFKGVTAALSRIPEFGDYPASLLGGRMKFPKAGKDAGDHPPITPTTKAGSKSSMKHDEWRLYEYVCRHFLATISPDAKFDKKSVKFAGAKQEFSLHGASVIDPGFTDIMPWIKVSDTPIPDFKIGQVCLISFVDVKTAQTQPPDHLTESELISLMEKHGIGTDASMATHINNICERNYVTVTGQGRRLEPTELGISLVHGYQKIDPELVAPTLRSNIEKSVDLIAKGKANYDEVLNSVITLFIQKYINFTQNISKMDAFFGGSFGTYEDAVIEAKGFSKCGKCNRLMKLVDKFHKLTCEHCKMTYDLPQNGSYKLTGERQCPLDNFQIILFHSHSAQLATYYICPKCYNDSPFPNIAANLSCNLCTYESCQYSVPNNCVKTCPKCNKGLLLLDQNPSIKPSLSCNYCTNHIIIGENVSKTERQKAKCQTCQAHLFKFTLRAPVVGLSQQLYDGICVFCHPEYSKFVAQKNPVVEQKESSSHGHHKKPYHKGRRGGKGKHSHKGK